jgi:integrase
MADPSVADLVRSFELHLRAENKAGRTIETYLDALRLAGGRRRDPVSPMAKMRPPAVPDQPVPLVREDAFRRLLEACAGPRPLPPHPRPPPRADLEWLWIGKFGRITESGIARIPRRRGRQAGLEGLHPHQLRHTFAHRWPSLVLETAFDHDEPVRGPVPTRPADRPQPARPQGVPAAGYPPRSARSSSRAVMEAPSSI